MGHRKNYNGGGELKNSLLDKFLAFFEFDLVFWSASYEIEDKKGSRTTRNYSKKQVYLHNVLQFTVGFNLWDSLQFIAWEKYVGTVS